MSNVIVLFEKVFFFFVVKIGKQLYVNVIKNGFICLMLLIFVGVMFVLINNVFLSFGEGLFFYFLGICFDVSIIEIFNGLEGIGGNVYNGILGIMFLMVLFFIGMVLVEECKVDVLVVGLLFVVVFMIVILYSVGEVYVVGVNWLGGVNIIFGIIIGLVVVEMFIFIVCCNWVIKLFDSVFVLVLCFFLVLIFGFIIFFVMGIIVWVLNIWGINFYQIIMDIILILLVLLGSVVGWVYVIFVLLFWFFGIYGVLVLIVLDNGIMMLWVLENIVIYQ